MPASDDGPSASDASGPSVRLREPAPAWRPDFDVTDDDGAVTTKGALYVTGVDDERLVLNVTVYDATTGRKLSDGEPPHFVNPGTYRVSVADAGAFPEVEVAAGHVTDLRLGAIYATGLDDERIRPELTIEETASGHEVGEFRPLHHVVPGSYRVRVSNGGIFRDVVVRPGEVSTLRLGIIEMTGGEGEPVYPEMDVFDPRTNERVAWNVHPPQYLAPGEYRIVVDDGGIAGNVRIEAGVRTSLALGAFYVRGVEGQRITPLLSIYDGVTGDKLAFRRPAWPHLLVPGTYRIAIQYGGEFDEVEIRPNEVTTLNLGAFYIRGLEGERRRPRVTVTDPTTGEDLANQRPDWPHLLVPGTYRVTLQYGGSVQDVEVRPNEVTDVNVGLLFVRDVPSGAWIAIVDKESGDRISYRQGTGPFLLVPGEYRVAVKDVGTRDVVIHPNEGATASFGAHSDLET